MGSFLDIVARVQKAIRSVSLTQVSEHFSGGFEMVEIRQVTVLPVVDASAFEDLPEDFAGKSFIVFGSKWNHAEEEAVLGLILTAAAHRGTWEAIPWSEIVEIVKSDMMTLMTLGKSLGYYVQKVAESGDIELVKLGSEIFVIPTTVLAQTLRGCQVRYFEVPPMSDASMPVAEPDHRSKPKRAFDWIVRWLFG
jgi:hypothetical protein